MSEFKIRGEHSVSKGLDLGRLDSLKDIVRHPERDNTFIAELYQRVNRALGGGVIIFSGAAIHLISSDRNVSDIDVFVSEPKLFLNEELKKRLEAEGFEISVLMHGKVYAILDKKSGIKIETANSSLKVDGKILTDHRDICRLLGCKEDTDTLVGFSSDTIMKSAMLLPIKMDDGTVIELMLPDPAHQIGLKYNLMRLRGGTKDIKDMRTIMAHYFGNFDSFVESGGLEKLRAVGEYLGPNFENRITEILRPENYE